MQNAFVDRGDFVFAQGPGIRLVLAGKYQAFVAGLDFIA